MRIFVGNLAFTTSEDELRQLFYGYGSVERVQIVTDRGFLPTFGDARRMATETRRAEEVFSSNGVGCPSPLPPQKRQKICQLPRFTKSGQESYLRRFDAYLRRKNSQQG